MPTIAEKLRKEGRKLGLQEGRKKGRQEGLQEGRQEGLQEGLQKGRQEGLEEGRKALAEAVWIHAKSKFKEISDTYKQKIQLLSSEQLKTIHTALFTMEDREQLDKYLPK